MAKKTLSQNETVPSPEPTIAQDEQSSIPSPDPQPSADVASQPIPAASAPAVDLEAIMQSITPEQLSRLKGLAAAKGVEVATGPRMKPDGGMVVEVELDAQMVEQLKLWAEADGTTLESQAKIRITEALAAYLYGDWSATIAKPEAAAAGAGAGNGAGTGT